MKKWTGMKKEGTKKKSHIVGSYWEDVITSFGAWNLELPTSSPD